MRYYVVYERSDTGWSAYPPDLPGVGVTGMTREEVRELVRGAIAMHIDGLREDGLPIPEPSGEFVDVA
jgi:predicted RNase H-like HicB family nuclease